MSKASNIGFAIVGAGMIARTHAAAIAATEGAELRAVYSRSPESAAALGKELGAPAANSFEELIERADIDVVCITTPSGAHADIALPALQGGKHVLCEKPLEISTERIDAMIEASENSRRILAAVFQQRFGRGAVLLKNAIDKGRFGNLSLCSAYIKWWRNPEYYSSSNWKGTAALDGGGAMMNQGIHGVDLLQHLAGMPKHVSAQTRRRAHDIEMEDTVAAVLEFSTGAIGVIEAATSCYPGTAMRIEIAGDKGSATLEEDRITRWEFASEEPEDEEVRAGHAGAIGGGAADPKAITTEGHRLLVADLVDAIRHKREPIISCREARNAVSIIEAAYRSAKENKPVAPL